MFNQSQIGSTTGYYVHVHAPPQVTTAITVSKTKASDASYQPILHKCGVDADPLVLFASEVSLTTIP